MPLRGVECPLRRGIRFNGIFPDTGGYGAALRAGVVCAACRWPLTYGLRRDAPLQRPRFRSPCEQVDSLRDLRVRGRRLRAGLSRKRASLVLARSSACVQTAASFQHQFSDAALRSARNGLLRAVAAQTGQCDADSCPAESPITPGDSFGLFIYGRCSWVE